jgi:hypothetical protein
VAYFASIVLLALTATQKPMMGDEENPTNYFDTVVFLTMFLLAGKYMCLKLAPYQRLTFAKAGIWKRTAKVALRTQFPV